MSLSPWRNAAGMNYFSVTNLFIGPSLLLFVAVSANQPTLKRKTTVMCLYIWLLAPLLVYPACMERHNLPPVLFWLDIAFAVFLLLSSIRLYRWSNLWIQKIEEMKQRSAKRAAYIESLRYKEDEEPA